MVSNSPADQTSSQPDDLSKEAASMIRNHNLRRQPANRANEFVKYPATPGRQEPNHPVPVEEFDREGMGVAAKE
jgi:hypothetical protein